MTAWKGAQIIFGYKPPKNWKENLKLQKDKEVQRLTRLWLAEKDPKIKEQYEKQAKEYLAKKRAQEKE